MRSIVIFLVLAVSILSCEKKTETIKVENTVTDSTAKIPTLVGNDVDAHGCKSSAGYTWSNLNQECMRMFETATRLTPYQNPVKEESSAFVIFSGDKAELFLPSEKSSLILERKSEGDQFVFGDYQLIPWKGYVLKKSGTILFTGQ